MRKDIYPEFYLYGGYLLVIVGPFLAAETDNLVAGVVMWVGGLFSWAVCDILLALGVPWADDRSSASKGGA